MNILALECGGAQIGMAALELNQHSEAAVRAVLGSDSPRALSSQIISGLQSTLSRADWSFDDIDALAVGLGPGSWTGLRIGLTTFKTLAQTRDLPLAGIPTFDALAQAAWRRLRAQPDFQTSRLLLVCAPCRANELYGKLYECAEDYVAVAQSEWVGTADQMAGALMSQALSHSIEGAPLLIGAPAQSVVEELNRSGETSEIWEVSIEDLTVELALAGAAKIEGGDGDDALHLQPLYIAPSAAERNFRAAGEAR